MYRKYLSPIYYFYAVFGMNSREYIHYLLLFTIIPMIVGSIALFLFMEINNTKYNLNI